MNSNSYYYHLMKLNVLSSSYVSNSYKLAWEANAYPYFHDTKYRFHYEVAKSFHVADEKDMNKLCTLLDDYVDPQADFSDFEKKIEKLLGKGNVLCVMHYVFQSAQYNSLMENVKANKNIFSDHFKERFGLKGYLQDIRIPY